MEPVLKQLSDVQLQTFDTEYVNDARWEIVKNLIDRDFPVGNFSFLDVGGGNGKFADKILQSYPYSRATVLDNSELLLSRNVTNPRKALINASVAQLTQQSHQLYDLVFFNWLLHHLVSNSHVKSCDNILTTLKYSASLLQPWGRVSIFENMYDGLMVDALPSKLIFELTSSKLLANFTRKMGANTSGVGVCFLSCASWHRTIAQTPFELDLYTDDPSEWPIPLVRKIILHLGNIRVGHFWLKLP